MFDNQVLDPMELVNSKGIKTVSFALYGTVLLRRCYNTEAVFEKTLYLSELPQNLKDSPDSFIQHRTLAYNVLRMLTQKTSENSTVIQISGVSIEDVYDRFAYHAFSIPRHFKNNLIASELKAECELSYINPMFMAYYRQAKIKGLKIGIVAETYWSAKHIKLILDTVAPSLKFDFIISSSDSNQKYVGNMFKSLIETQKINPSQAAHIGIDDDTVEQPTLGISLAQIPIETNSWYEKLSREELVAKVFTIGNRGFHWRFDSGFNIIRMDSLSQIKSVTHHQMIGAAVFGPLMLGFQKFIQNKIAAIKQKGRNVQVVFLARDGYLPMRVWQAMSHEPAGYVEINRRIAMIAGAEAEGGVEMIQNLIALMDQISAVGVEEFFKIKITPKIKNFFESYEDHIAPGIDFSLAITKLIGKKKITEISENLRNDLLRYLDSKIIDFDQCTDFVMIDIGYTGNIQKGMRRVFDVSKRKISIHGIYLLPHGESFVSLDSQDSACGYIDDTVMPPAIKRALMRDAPLIEEFFCAPVGSAKGYDGLKEIREIDSRLKQDIRLCLEVQDECIRYIDTFREKVTHHGIDPFENFENYRAWTATILARFIMMPTTLECDALGRLLHDVSLGSQALMPTINSQGTKNLMGTLPFASVCSIHHPPVWLAGSLTAYNQMSGFAYAMVSFSLPVDEVLKDQELESISAAIIKDNQEPISVPVSQTLTPFGDVRLRIPVLGKDSESMIAIHLEEGIMTGVVRTMSIQTGKNLDETTNSRNLSTLSFDKLQGLRIHLQGKYYEKTGEHPYLLISVPKFKEHIGVVTLLITPIS